MCIYEQTSVTDYAPERTDRTQHIVVSSDKERKTQPYIRVVSNWLNEAWFLYNRRAHRPIKAHGTHVHMAH